MISPSFMCGLVEVRADAPPSTAAGAATQYWSVPVPVARSRETPLGMASRANAALLASVIVTTARASADAVNGRLRTSIVLIVPATASARTTPSALSRHRAGSPAQVALLCTPAVTTAAASTSRSRSRATAT